ncbi:16S rRNA (cytidine(1402)-2'-O)-methyltransferase [Methylococcus geothermalis]|uniref:Ribosomal RNA small subunit methyltransferase I n=1 Tax=Methylococcus geothermalis TaxID=2681310 RepID=A0A858Q4A5_9GAMM|nr:16S rRNA (cytidine(1402)-2'-O)-methyltransferase [Methylococcus geothermalis]QJD28655.1 16S rRNA (cytidine(1402)-2'-O)-methyltransferase [Methylococcus geothermalis]
MQASERMNGVLYLVATPIGNLGDISLRAVEILKSVDLIAAEDTRHSRPLLDRYGIDRPLFALHEHNEQQASDRLIDRLKAGQCIALISDAGTPLINDPGFPLVSRARAAGIIVTPVPGACALVTALSASGLSAARFVFEGFAPRTGAARRRWFESLVAEERTLVFYEASHRIRDCIADIATVFPEDRGVVVARELTKLHENFVCAPAADMPALMDRAPENSKGEFVVMIEGAKPEPAQTGLSPEALRVLKLLLEECSLKSAAGLAARITGARREDLYRAALELKHAEGDRV